MSAASSAASLVGADLGARSCAVGGGPLAIDLEVADWTPAAGPPVTGRALSVSLFAGPSKDSSRAAFFEGSDAAAASRSAILSLRVPLCWHAPFHAHILSKLLGGSISAAALASVADDTLDMAAWVRPGMRGGASLPSLSRAALADARKGGVDGGGPALDLEPKRDMSELFNSNHNRAAAAASNAIPSSMNSSFLGLEVIGETETIHPHTRVPPDAVSLATDPLTRQVWLEAVERDAERVWWTHKYLSARLRAASWRPDAAFATPRRRGASSASSTLLDGYREITRPLRGACVHAESKGVPINSTRIKIAIEKVNAAIEELRKAEEEVEKGLVTPLPSTKTMTDLISIDVVDLGFGTGLAFSDIDHADSASDDTNTTPPPQQASPNLPHEYLWRLASTRAQALIHLLEHQNHSQRLFLSVGPAPSTGRARSTLPSSIPHLPPWLFPRITPPLNSSRVVAAASKARAAITSLIPSSIAAPRNSALILVSLPLALEAIVAAHAARDVALTKVFEGGKGWSGLAYALWSRRDALAVTRARDVARACLLGSFPVGGGVGAGAAAALLASASGAAAQTASEVYVAARLGAAWGVGVGQENDAVKAVSAFYTLAPTLRMAQAKLLEDAEKYGRSWSLSGRSIVMKTEKTIDTTTSMTTSLDLFNQGLLGGATEGSATGGGNSPSGNSPSGVDWAHLNRRLALGARLTADVSDVANLVFSDLTRACGRSSSSTNLLTGYSPVLILGHGGGECGSGAILLEGPLRSNRAAASEAAAVMNKSLYKLRGSPKGTVTLIDNALTACNEGL